MRTSNWHASAATLILVFVGIAVVTLINSPLLVSFVERTAGRGGSIDFILRIHFLYASGLVLLLSTSFFILKDPRDQRWYVVVTLLAAHLVVLMGIWLLDPVEFNREFSSIRFFSSGALLLAALLAFANLEIERFRGIEGLGALAFWGLMGTAFLAAGLDDRFAVHEAIGLAMAPVAERGGWPRQLVQDGITVLYGIGAVGFVVAFRRYFLHRFFQQGMLAGWLLAGGIVVYGVAVTNDVLDEWVGRLLHPLNPEYGMNFTEEALEFSAAVLFVASLSVAMLEYRPRMYWTRSRPYLHKRLRRWFGRGIVAVAAIATAAPWLLMREYSNDWLAHEGSPGSEISVFADAHDGLDNVDELLFVPGHGLLAGNETTGEVLLFDAEGQSTIFSSSVGSPDGMAYAKNRIFVADDLSGEIFEFSLTGSLLSVMDGWERPEGIAAGPDGSLYVADLPRRLVARINGSGQRSIVASSLDGLGSPEQLAIDAFGRLFIADERERAVFRVDLDGKIDRHVDSRNGTGVPESILVRNGRLYVADALSGTIKRFSKDGDREVLVSFLRKKDLAGMTFDAVGNLYVAVTSDYRPHNQILRIRLSKGAEDGAVD